MFTEDIYLTMYSALFWKGEGPSCNTHTLVLEKKDIERERERSWSPEKDGERTRGD